MGKAMIKKGITAVMINKNKVEQQKAWLLSVKLFFISLVVISLSACMPSGNENVNTELFKDKQEMHAKANQLERQMPKPQVFSTLEVPEERFTRMSTEQVQMAVYGNSQVQGTPEQLERFRQRLSAYEGYSLPYRQVKSKSSLGFGKIKTNSTGHDLQLVLIFEKSRLLKASVVGSEELNKTQDSYLWNSLIKKGVGTVF